MPSLREQQQQFEHGLFAGVGTKRKQRINNNRRSNNQRIGKEELKEQIIQHHRKQYPSAFDAARNKLPYLYDTKQSHPVKEFKPSEEELKAASITPSFVLEVTWPRVIQFYHPSSPYCKDFHSTYVNLARSIKRRSSRLPVEFYAVNCGVYRDVCDQGFKIKSVPSFLALKSGRIDAKQLFLPGDNEGKLTSKAEIAVDVTEKVEYISDVLGFTLDALKGQSSAYASEVANNIQLSDSINDARAADMPQSSSGLSQSEQVFHDATSSFLATMASSIYSKHPPGSSLPLKDSQIFEEFLDLLRWAYPPETKVHTVATELKQDFLSITLKEEGLQHVLSRHNPEGVTWSERCSGDSTGANSHDDPYSCGFWSLLHVISIGVAERHTSVVGDVTRVSVQHAGQSIRSFIDAFFIGCDSCKKSWIELYDEACCGLHNSDHSLALGNQLTGTNEEWKQLAIWIWEVHNEINARRQRYKTPTSFLWPSREECPKCWPSENGLTATSMDSFDHEALFNHLKRSYWISGHHNNRLVVIDRWSKAKRAISMGRLRDRMASREFSIVGTFMRFLFVFVLLRAAIQLCTRRAHHARRIKRRQEAADRDRRDDDESTHYNRNKSSSTNRSRRSVKGSTRWPTINNNAIRPASANDNTSRRYRVDHRPTSYTRYSPLRV